jgi:hypothetical protein
MNTYTWILIYNIDQKLVNLIFFNINIGGYEWLF